MKKICGICIAAFTVVLSPTLPADEKEERSGTWLSNWGEFKPTELRSLADKPANQRNNRKLMELILFAGVEGDASFRDLLKRKDLREANNVDLALSAYDYMLNQSEPALYRILGQLATEDIGADVDTTLVLAFLNEWDLTLRAVRKHFYRTDGAGGGNKYLFGSTRAYLYPEKYAEMREIIEAPVVWPGRLIPKRDEGAEQGVAPKP